MAGFSDGNVDYDFGYYYVTRSYGSIIVDFWIEITKLHQKYWWLRSPDTVSSDGAFRVYPSGDVYYHYGDYGVIGSYGSKHRRARICLHVLFILIR